jgi:tRNA 5-methylaminomethyl-2-thiouridine biosynthesis bifunctional protein
MPSTSLPLVPAALQFDARGLPFSSLYGDIYRPQAAPLEQARQVFLRGNRLPDRWAGQRSFTVCETGFGLGHNFLALWHAWRACSYRPQRLHVVSLEAHPFNACDLRHYFHNVLEGTEAQLGAQLANAWPVLVPGVHQLAFENGAIELTLLFGPVERMARQLDARVDAFFLDGFSPKVNPAMWSHELFGQLVRVANPNATAATWCCAGAVRRALSDEGFLVQKVPGFGAKHEMTVASLRPGLGHSRASRCPQTAVVIGAGIAGAATARALARRGCQVSVFDPVLARSPGASHAGHLAVAISPMLNRTDDLRARFSRAGVLHAWQQWQGLPAPAAPVRCGTFYPALSPAQAGEYCALLARLSLPEQWARWLDAEQASQYVGGEWSLGGVWFAYGQLAQPEPLLDALLGHPGIQCVPARVCRIASCCDGDAWQVFGTDGQAFVRADLVVLANAAGAPDILQASCIDPAYPRLNALSAVAGEVYYDDAPRWPALRAIVAGNGYALPACGSTVVLGSTYRRGVGHTALSLDGQQQVMEKMRILLAQQCPQPDTPHEVSYPAGLQGWAGWRASVSDRFPVLGPAAVPGLWVNACHASRGFSGSALAADILASAEFGEPVPIERDLRAKLALR